MLTCLPTDANISSPIGTPGESQVTLQWSVGNTLCPIDFYTLEYELVQLDGCQFGDGSRTEPIVFNATSSSEFIVMGLESYSIYTFYLTPHNIVGDGDVLVFYNVTTNEEGMVSY